MDERYDMVELLGTKDKYIRNYVSPNLRSVHRIYVSNRYH